MSRAWVTDRWVRDATVTLPDGTTTKISPTSAQLKAIRTLPDHFRTARFGTGNRWLVGWYEPGSTKSKTKTFAKRAEADAFAAEMEDDLRSGRYIDPAGRDRTFASAAETWLKSKNRIKDSTWRRYRRELDNYVLPQWGTRKIGSIRREQIDAWVTHLRDGTAVHVFDVNEHIGKARTPVKMKPNYVKHVVGATFGGVLRFAVGEKWIGENPLARVELPRDEGDIENDLPSLSYVEIDMIASAAEELTRRETDRVLTELLANSGPRIGEATALKIKDLHLDRKRARVHRTWTTDREGHRKLGPVKTWEKRWLPLAEHVVDGLKNITKDRDPEDFVFVTVRGAAVDGGNWYNRVWLKARRVVAAASDYSVHDLRHVAATNAIAAGADPKLVQQMLGHKDATETLNTYSHLWPDRVAEVIAKVEKRRKKALRKQLAKAA
ncbi:tyrosine-type recombinase/integrase [Microbacterium arabinogalactanolyticum]|uniref:tyrosine-type recombinase/integrase n=1 Tax=Microbacterium arabinogalactanolyticum TaxID=69365 RepID=UPI0040440D5D